MILDESYQVLGQGITNSRSNYETAVKVAKQAAIADISAALAENALRHRVAETLPIAETARAHELIESGGVEGCVVVRID